jgi:biopolymer transport protein ExbD/biopolymer transport protein TolR
MSPLSSRGAVRSEINVTPLVDVCLVLLIIFMVVAPRMEQDVQVDIPGIFNPDPEVETSVDPLKVTVARSGEYYINDQKYGLDDAIEVLSSEHAAEPLRRLMLRADAKLTYGQVRDIFSRAQKVGFPGMALMVGEKNRAQPPPAGGDQKRDPAREKQNLAEDQRRDPQAVPQGGS